MTDKQLRQAGVQLREEMRAHGYGFIDGKYIEPPEEYETRKEELYCISMINSILAYQCAGMTDAERVMQSEERRYHNYLADYVKVLGRARVVELIQGQIDDIAYVAHNVCTDGEGLSYNTIIWKEEYTNDETENA